MPQTIDNMLATWNNVATTFTAIKMTVTDSNSASGSLLLDLRVGPDSKFYVRKDGAIVTGTGGKVVSELFDAGSGTTFASGGVYLNSSAFYRLNNDTFIGRRAAASLRLGAADTTLASAVAQTLGVQSVTGTDVSAATLPFRITGAQGTGTGAGGSIEFQVAPAGVISGTAQNALATALTISSNLRASFAGNIQVPNGGFVGNPNAYLAGGASASIYFANGDLRFYTNSTNSQFRLTNSPSSLLLGESTSVSWGNSTDTGSATPDVILARDAANTLALRNGANAQSARIYGSYTSASVYKRLALSSSTTAATVAAQTDTGDMDLELTPAGTGNVKFGTHSAVGAETITGFITIKDAGGTVRKLAVIS